MNAFGQKMSENIKFNLSPLITRISAKYSFESEIIKTLSFFNNKNFKQNILNSSTHKSTLRPQSEKNKLYYNKNTINKQNITTKSNYKPSPIDNTLKDNNYFKTQTNYNTNKCNSIKPKKPNNFSININNNTNNFYYNCSNNLFNDKIIERNKRDTRRIKTEISQHENKKTYINNNNNVNNNINAQNNKNKSNNIGNLKNKIYSYNTNRNYFNKKQKEKFINNNSINIKSSKNSINKNIKFTTKINNNSQLKINNNKSKVNNKKRNILIPSNNNQNNNIISYKTYIPLSSKVNNNYNINFYALNSINSDKLLYNENVNGNEYHTLENNMHGFKKFIINNFNLCDDDNFELINKKASKTYNNGFFRDYSRKNNNKDNKKNNNNKDYKIKIFDEKINEDKFDNLHIYPNNHNYYEFKINENDKFNKSIKKNNYIIHTDSNKYDYKGKLSKIRQKTEGLLDHYSKLLKLFAENKKDVNNININKEY
jgi:hypothetical protein